MNGFLSSCTVALVCSPDGPGTPFGNGLLALLDAVRIVCVAAALATLGLAPSMFSHMETAGQRARIIALMLFTMQAVTTETEHIGDYASLRLAFNLAAALYGLYGIYQLRKERPAQRIRSRNDPPSTG